MVVFIELDVLWMILHHLAKWGQKVEGQGHKQSRCGQKLERHYAWTAACQFLSTYLLISSQLKLIF